MVVSMSVVRDLILQADDELRYPTGGELRSMVDFLSTGANRLSVVRVLTDNEKKIVDEASKQPLVAPVRLGCWGVREPDAALLGGL